MNKAERIVASKALSKINLNIPFDPLDLKTYWCRVAFDKWNFKNHSHSFFELHLCLKGECVFMLDQKIIRLTEDSFIIVPPGKGHTLASISEDFEKFVWGFAINSKELAALLCTSCRSADACPASSDMINAVNIMLKNADSTKFAYYAILKGQLELIFILILRLMTNIKNSSGESEVKSGVLSESIKRFIADNLSEKLKTEDIAAQFFISKRQLLRICISECGMTIEELKKAFKRMPSGGFFHQPLCHLTKSHSKPTLLTDIPWARHLKSPKACRRVNTGQRSKNRCRILTFLCLIQALSISFDFTK